jgi:hypothetical protein
LSRHHLIQQLSDKTKSINLVIMFAGREAQKLSFELREPRSIGGGREWIELLLPCLPASETAGDSNRPSSLFGAYREQVQHQH